MKSTGILAGETFKTNEGGEVRVISVNGCFDIIIEHMDDHAHQSRVVSSQLRDGRIKNPYRPRIAGVGFLGSGPYKASENGRDTHAYTAWTKMLERVYCTKKQSKNKSYIGCLVAPEWHNFQEFCRWYEAQPFKGEGYQLDKDILVPGNKQYGPAGSRFVPEPINKMLNTNVARRSSLPVGVTKSGKKYSVKLSMSGAIKCIGSYESVEDAFSAYKSAREGYVRSMAEKYKDKMQKEIYDALMRYRVNAND